DGVGDVRVRRPEAAQVLEPDLAADREQVGPDALDAGAEGEAHAVIGLAADAAAGGEGGRVALAGPDGGLVEVAAAVGDVVHAEVGGADGAALVVEDVALLAAAELDGADRGDVEVARGRDVAEGHLAAGLDRERAERGELLAAAHDEVAGGGDDELAVGVEVARGDLAVGVEGVAEADGGDEGDVGTAVAADGDEVEVDVGERRLLADGAAEEHAGHVDRVGGRVGAGED